MRKPRELLPGSSYHVTAKINRGAMELEPDYLKELFLETVIKAKNKYSFRISNFCIMNNHIHLYITPEGESPLSRIMQWILSIFARRFNKIFKYSGHVWQNRFSSKPIVNYIQMINTFLYICNNPVKAQLASSMNNYKYGGLFHYLNNHERLLSGSENYLYKLILQLVD